MKIATLFRNDAAERWVVPALAADGGTVLRHADLGGLMSTLRDDTVDAVILEDSPSDVHHWLLVLQSNDLRKLPIIVLGAGMAGGVATALHGGASGKGARRGFVESRFAGTRDR